MVLLERIELSTSALPRMRSTTELQQHTISHDCLRLIHRLGRRALLAGVRGIVKDRLAKLRAARQLAAPMANDPAKMTREERLAAKLRENLRRRKAQSKAQSGDQSKPAALPEDVLRSQTLPKSDGKS